MKRLILLFLSSMLSIAAYAQTSGLPAPSTLSYYANAGTTGTTLNTLTKLTGAPSTAVIAATTDTAGVIGVTVGNAGTSGVASIQVNGIASLVFDGATTAGDYVQISATTAGNGHDAGSTCPSSGQVVGRVLSTNASGGTYQVTLGSNGCGSGGGSVNVNGSPVSSPNLNGTTPPAGSNGKNVTWQASGSSVSAEVVGDGVSTHYLDGTGSYSSPPGSGTQVDVLSDQRPTGNYFHGPQIEYFSGVSGTPITLLNQSGAGVVSSFFVATTDTAAHLQYGTVNITINGEGTPYISGKVSQVMGCYYIGQSGVATQSSSRIFGSNGTACTLYAPVPFSNGITITLTPSTSGFLYFADASGDTAANTWNYTRKLWEQFLCTGSGATLCGTATATPANYAQMQVANFYSANPGRLLGINMMYDGTPGTVSPSTAPLEGNIRIFVDSATAVWAANTAFATSTTIMDSNGNQQTWGGGTTGGTIPATWGCNTGATTSDGTGTWTATVGYPTGVWRGSQAYSVTCMSAFDSTGTYVITVTATGTTGGTQPTCTSPGQTITDGTVTWKCSPVSSMIDVAVKSTGIEDFFYSSNYFSGENTQNSIGSNEIGMTTKATNTYGAYRFFLHYPVRFNHSIAIYASNGDSSEKTYTGTPAWAFTTFFYSQDTN